jgi:hypothetical protein
MLNFWPVEPSRSWSSSAGRSRFLNADAHFLQDTGTLSRRLAPPRTSRRYSDLQRYEPFRTSIHSNSIADQFERGPSRPSRWTPTRTPRISNLSPLSVNYIYKRGKPDPVIPVVNRNGEFQALSRRLLPFDRWMRAWVPNLKPVCAATIGHLIFRMKKMLASAPLSVSKLPCPLETIRSACSKCALNSGLQSSSTVPGASDPLSMTSAM